MRRDRLVLGFALLAACSGETEDRVAVPDHDGATKTVALARAERRAFDGAPPVIPHPELGSKCTVCHNERGVGVPEYGFAPPSPHGSTDGLSALSRCTQCHVFRNTEVLFVETGFEGFAQDLRAGARQHSAAPPVMPHAVFMRENCQACHTGPAAREEIRTAHPERTNCTQCHVERVAQTVFARGSS